MANHGLELPGEVVVDSQDQTGTRHIYTILGSPRSIVISRNRNNRPLYTAWSKFTCKLCPNDNMQDLTSLQLHMAEQHGLDLRGTTIYSVPGQLTVLVKPYDTSTDHTFGYDLKQFTTYVDHNQDQLYTHIHEVELDRAHGGAACLLCPDNESKFHIRDKLHRHIDLEHKIKNTCTRGNYVWRHLVDETGYHVIDTQLRVDPLSVSPQKQILSTEDREINDTQEGFLTAYDEKGMILYTLQPLIKPKLKNSRNDYLYRSDTVCVCQICLQRPGTNPAPTLRLEELKRHMENKHNISLNHPYNRQPGQIEFQSTKVVTRADELFDEKKTLLLCDQNGTPVVYKKRPPIHPDRAWFCLRCVLRGSQARDQSHVFDHLKHVHNILLHQDLTQCYLSPVGDSVIYLEIVDQLPSTGFTSSNTGQSTQTTSRSNVKHHAAKPEAIKTGEDTSSIPKPKSKPKSAKSSELCFKYKKIGKSIWELSDKSDSSEPPSAVPSRSVSATSVPSSSASHSPARLGQREQPEMAVTTKRSTSDANLNPVGLAILSKRPRISTNVTSVNTTQGIPLVDPNANTVGLDPAKNTSNTAQESNRTIIPRKKHIKVSHDHSRDSSGPPSAVPSRSVSATSVPSSSGSVSPARLGQREQPGVTCTICHKTFHNRSNLLRHMRDIHDSEPENSIFCTVCKKPYLNQNMLRRHMKEVHDKLPENFIYCTICKKPYSNKSNGLRKHMIRKHPETVQPTGMAVTTKRSTSDANLNPVGLAHLSRRPRMSTNVTSVKTTLWIPPVDPNANTVGLDPAKINSNTAQVCPSCPGNCQCSRPPGTTPSSSDIGTSERTTFWRPWSTTQSATMPNPQSSVASTESMAVTTKRSTSDANLNPVGLAHLSRRPRIFTNGTSANTTQGIPLVDPNANYVGLDPAANTSNTDQIRPAPVASSSQNLVTSVPGTFPSQSSVIQAGSSPPTLTDEELCQRGIHSLWCEHFNQLFPDFVTDPRPQIKPAPVTSSSQNLVTSVPVTSPSQSSVIQADMSPPIPTDGESCVFCGQLMTDCKCFPPLDD